MKTFNIGIIGSGRIARIHCLALKLLPNVNVQGVTSQTLAHAEKFAQEFGISKVYSSIEEMCADPTIDAVHICNINTAHHAALHQAISAGKAVICEKPLCVSTEQIHEIINLSPGNIVHTCFVYRFHFAAQALKKYIQEHGAPKKLQINYHQASWLKKQPWQPHKALYGKSYVLADIGVHAFDLAAFLLGQKLNLTDAQVHFSGEKHQCSDIAAELDLLGESGTETHISVMKNSTQHNNHIFLQATYDHHSITIPTEHVEGWLDGFLNLFSLFYQQLRGEKNKKITELPTLQESLQIQQLIDKIFETGDWQAL